jgi:flagellar protein FliJ
MRNTGNLPTLKRLASHAESSQARQLALAQSQARREEERLQQIASYFADYHQQLQAAGGSVTPAELASRRAFVARLGRALSDQQGTVARCQQAVASEQQRWETARTQARTIERLAERRQESADAERARREQRQLDEAALRRYR